MGSIRFGWLSLLQPRDKTNEHSEPDDLCRIFYCASTLLASFFSLSCVLLHNIALKVHRVRERSTHSQGITNHRGKVFGVLCFLGDRLCVISVCVTCSDNLCTRFGILLCVFSLHSSFFLVRVHGAGRFVPSALCSQSASIFSMHTVCTYNHRTLSFRFMDILAFRRWQSSTIASAIAHTLTALNTVKFVHSLLALSPLRMLNVTMHSDTYWQFVIFCVNTRYCIVRGRTNQQMNYYFSPKKRATTKNPKNRKIFSNHEFVSKNEWFRFFSLFRTFVSVLSLEFMCTYLKMQNELTFTN